MRIASMIRIKLFYFPPSSPRQQLALNKLEQFALRAFFCLHRTCYIYLSLSRRPCGLLAVACPPASRYPRKRESPDPDLVGSIIKEECDGTHANRPETRILQRRPAQGGNYWLRLRWLAPGAALRRSRAQGHGV